MTIFYAISLSAFLKIRGYHSFKRALYRDY